MRRVIRNPVTWTAAGFLGAFWVGAKIIPNNTLMEGLRMLQTSVSVAVVVAYFPVVFETLRQNRGPDRVQQLSMGIVLGFLANVLGGLWLLLWRLSGQPQWMLNSDFYGFIIWMVLLAGVLHITAPGAVNGIIPKRNWISLGMAFGAGALISGWIIAAQPYTGRFTDMLRPLLAEYQSGPIEVQGRSTY